MAGGDLYFGDNLEVLREYIKDESVDLIYLDPPFNSRRDYNVLFAESDATDSDAQIHAFEDTWHWDRNAEKTYRELTDPDSESHGIPTRLVTLMEALRTFLGANDVMAYLTMMAVRLVELRRVLKPTGSLYLHCDPTASHYLKLVLDSIFGQENFRNEIVWKRSYAHSDAKQGAQHYGRVTDSIFFYSKSETVTWNSQYVPYDQEYIDRDYRRTDPDGRRYRIGDLSGPGGEAKGNPKYEFLGVTRYWRYSQEKMQALYEAGRIVQTRPGAVPQYKRYLDEMPGVPVQNLWTDIPVINNRSNESLGYPTQKPVALLERIVSTSSNKGDVVLDPFCGCGTAVHAAQRLDRKWIGIDVTHLAIALIRNRLDTAFPGISYRVIGEPMDAASAKVLADSDPYQFQWWALHLIGARPVGEATGKVGKKGQDRGIDGMIRFRDDPTAATSERILVSVKAGANIGPAMVRDLRGTIEREGAPIGVLFTMEEPTKEMRTEAVKAGVWHSDKWNRDYPRVQLITVEQAFEGKRVEYPGQDVTLQAAPTQHPEHEVQTLPGMAPAPAAGPRKGRGGRKEAPRAAPVEDSNVRPLFAAEPVAKPARKPRKK